MGAPTYDAGKHTSLWLDTSPQTSYGTAAPEVTVDVAVVGGGIVGINAGLFLAQEGQRVAVLESGRILAGVTGFTTAKLTANHGLIYKHLVDHFGDEKARLYADANQTAMRHVVSHAEQSGIGCDLQQVPAYTYGASESERQQLQDEAAAAAACGLPAVYTEDVPLPLQTAGAVRFDDQYLFHPRKYLLVVAEEFTQAGGSIFEESRVTKMDEGDDGCEVTTDHGVVRARDVIIATNYPIKDPKLFFARLAAHQSYVLGVCMEQPFPQGMFYSTDESEHTLRPHWAGTEQEIVLVGGETHQVGQGGDITQRYRTLEEWTRRHFAVRSIEYYWTTHDAEPYDKVPMIGKLTSSTRHLYVATGFRGWGMTHGVVAGMLLRDEILGRENPWSKLYNPNRLSSFVSGEMLASNANIISTLIKGKLKTYDENIAGLANGEAKVIEVDGEKIAIYRDEAGVVHAVSAVCTHMGCTVAWDNAEKSWDCPCHGSRFDCDGRVIHSPAVHPLKPYESIPSATMP